jgi:hypothetical protein
MFGGETKVSVGPFYQLSIENLLTVCHGPGSAQRRAVQSARQYILTAAFFQRNCAKLQDNHNVLSEPLRKNVMKTIANSTASLELSSHAADFTQRVCVNQAKLTSGLRPDALRELRVVDPVAYPGDDLK